jgi:hypothetical protein
MQDSISTFSVSADEDVTSISDLPRDFADLTDVESADHIEPVEDEVEVEVEVEVEIDVADEDSFFDENELEDVTDAENVVEPDVSDEGDVEFAVGDEEDAEQAASALDEVESSSLAEFTEEVAFEQSVPEPTEGYTGEDDEATVREDETDEDLSLR